MNTKNFNPAHRCTTQLSVYSENAQKVKRLLIIMALSLLVALSSVAQSYYQYSYSYDSDGDDISNMNDYVKVGNGIEAKLYHNRISGNWITFLDFKQSSSSGRNYQEAYKKVLYKIDELGSTETIINLYFANGVSYELKNFNVYDDNITGCISFKLNVNINGDCWKNMLQSDISAIEAFGIKVPLSNFHSAATLTRMHNACLNHSDSGNSGGNSGGNGNGHYNSTAGFSYSGTVRNVTLPSSSVHTDLRDNIKEYKTGKVGTLTSTGAGVIIRGGNGYYYTAKTPEALKTKMKSIHDAYGTIVEVNITEQNNWVIIYGTNDYYYSYGAPSAFCTGLETSKTSGEEIWSACFHENGRWAIVTNKYMRGDDETRAFMKRAEALYGEVISCFVTGIGRIACCKNGVYYENIPSNLAEKIGKLSYLPKYIKFTDNGLHIITGYEASQYDYYM